LTIGSPRSCFTLVCFTSPLLLPHQNHPANLFFIKSDKEANSWGQGRESAGARVSGTMDEAAASSASASASAGRSNPSASAVQVCPPPLLPTAVSFDSMRGGVRWFPWIDGAMLVEIRGSCAADRQVSACLRRDLALVVRDSWLRR
jgi:hypothetical protein